MLNVVLGYKGEKPIVKDITKDRMITICGVAGSGKTTYILELISQLMLNHSPDDFKIIGSAFKNNLDFKKLERTRHMEKIFIQDLGLIDYLKQRMQEREQELKEKSEEDLYWIIVLIDDLVVSKVKKSIRDELDELLPSLRDYKMIPIMTAQRPTNNYITDKLFDETTTFVLTKLSMGDLVRFSIDADDVKELYTLERLVITDKSRYVEVENPVDIPDQVD